MPDPPTLPSPPVRRRLLGVLFAGSALTRTGLIAALTVAALAAEDMLGSATLGGLPAATATIGIAAGTPPISWLMARSGRRIGLGVGLAVSAGGGGLAALAVNAGSFPIFVAGMFLFGMGIAAERLSRYAAADITPLRRQAFAISLVVWAGTIGSVLGPVLLAPAEGFAESLGIEGLAGPLVMAALFAAVAAVVVLRWLRPDPLSFAPVHDPAAPSRAGPRLAGNNARVALAALIVGQVVMVMIMTMTPVHIRRAGEELGIVGLVIAAHTLGMFAFSPLTGFLSDRFGRVKVIVIGQIMLLVSAVLASFAAGDERVLLVASLFLLGLGWNFGFVAASALLTEGAPASSRVPLQGLADSIVWTSAAIASLSSGALLELGSYSLLALLGASLVVIPFAVLARYRPGIAATGS
ncbi:MAG: MFS transporter [Acidimicrobiia bacterium]|nr:MFS transporter [Acidimicrobiia bacterium]MBT8193318.1 MFS transporter [Acidimicrobiia bacterium]MBT8247446.1 MFS transporter [Acidimicrobiia bacterium]NNF87184.1 MFS transporter [Acidimicrobiia bacterium]NNJ48450.1 MFS transporter [Acidimicrobiia bacterium]